jgi:N-methylhydantoinase A
LHSSVTFHIGRDIGGTFTEVVAVDSTGRTFADKADTTPADLSIGLLAARATTATASSSSSTPTRRRVPSCGPTSS